MIHRIINILLSYLPFQLSENQKYLTKNAGSTVTITSTALILRVIFFIVLYSSTEITVFGKFVCYLILLDVCSFLASLGAPQYLYQKLPQLARKKEHVKLRTLIKLSTKVCFWGSIIFSIVGTVSYLFFFKDFITSLGMFFFLLSIPLFSILKLREESLKALGHTLSGYLGYDIFGISLNILFLTVYVLLGKAIEFEAIIITYTIALVLSFLLSIFLYTLKVKLAYKEYDWRMLQKRWLIGMIGYFGIASIDKSLQYIFYGIILISFGFTESSVFWLLVEIISFTTLVTTVINTSLLPFFQQSISYTPKRLKIIFNKSRLFSFFSTLIICTVLAVLLYIINILKGLELNNWYPILITLVIGAFIDNLTSPRNLLLFISRNGKTVIQIKLFTLFLIILGSVFLLSPPSLLMIAIIYLGSKIISNGLIIWKTKQKIQL